MKKVLIFGMTENPGGVETFLMNYYRRLNSKRIHFDFLGATNEKIAFEDEISKNSIVYHISKRREHPIKYFKEVHSFFKNHAKEYDCIWVNLNTLINMDYLKLAKKYGIKKIIIHSHSSQNMDSKPKKIIHNFNKKRLTKYSTDYWACSELAAKWFFPQRIQSKVKIIKNAIDIDEFKFDQQKRDSLRKKYNLENNFVIGNVGRLHFEKNQEFAIKILKYLNDKNIKLVLVGQGPDKDRLKSIVNDYQLNDQIIFAGVQSDMKAWYSCFDFFIFPSLFEGLGLAGVEAQANGLPVLSSSKNIPSELSITSNFKFLNLDDGPRSWANTIKNWQHFSRLSQSQIENDFNKSGYNINANVNKLENLFLG